MKLSLESHGKGATTAAQAWCVDPMVHSMQLPGMSCSVSTGGIVALSVPLLVPGVG